MKPASTALAHLRVEHAGRQRGELRALLRIGRCMPTLTRIPLFTGYEERVSWQDAPEGVVVISHLGRKPMEEGRGCQEVVRMASAHGPMGGELQ